MATNVYVDGPNVYYRALKDQPVRWLDLSTWCERLLADHDVQRVRYFTAWANPAQGSIAVDRQRVYLRALASDPRVTLHFGRCVRQADRLRDVNRPRAFRLVEKVRIKGVDVALVTALFDDVLRGECDTAVLVTCDSDLVPAIQLVRRQGVRVGVINPSKGRTTFSLRKDADFTVVPTSSSYRDAQFPPEMLDRHGPFHVPPSWLPTSA